MKYIILLITLMSASALFANATRDRGSWGCCSSACHQKCMDTQGKCDMSCHKDGAKDGMKEGYKNRAK